MNGFYYYKLIIVYEYYVDRECKPFPSRIKNCWLL